MWLPPEPAVSDIPQHERQWEPLGVSAVADLFRAARFPWWVAGGHAIELAIGKSVRPHDDIDVLILRQDQLAARALLGGWDCWVADPPGTLRFWPVGEVLPKASHDIWCRESPDAPWRLQLMLDESDASGEHWRSRRDPRVSWAVNAIGLRDSAGVPYLRPEIQLFYKAKSRRAKDDADFAAVLPMLRTEQRAWLRAAIVMTYGDDHPWWAGLSGLAGLALTQE